jgi:uncharacterized protein YutE (UPF0331/DUF86 family)
MEAEFSGIERRLDRLCECLQKLEALQSRPLEEFLKDAYLRDIAERNLEVAVQCCIDIANRIISLEEALKPADYYEGFVRLGEIGVLPIKFARRFASIAGLRNVLVHEYLAIDWDEVYAHLQNLGDLHAFAASIRQWMADQGSD